MILFFSKFSQWNYWSQNIFSTMSQFCTLNNRFFTVFNNILNILNLCIDLLSLLRNCEAGILGGLEKALNSIAEHYTLSNGPSLANTTQVQHGNNEIET
jgi:hypothetical protein